MIDRKTYQRIFASGVKYGRGEAMNDERKIVLTSDRDPTDRCLRDPTLEPSAMSDITPTLKGQELLA